MKKSINLIVLVASTTLAVIMDPSHMEAKHHQIPPETHHPELLQSSEPQSFHDSLRSCFAKRSHGTLECLNQGAMSALQSWNDDECLDFGSVKLERSEGQSRSILDLDWDPKDMGNVVRAASRMLERRNLKWDLGTVYPGLQMRVGPTLSAGNGLLEFVMDERTANAHYHNRQYQPGTGRLLLRQLVLPFLLGFKFNLASLLPLLFGMLIIVSKKAFLLTKVALFIAGLLGWNTLFGGFNNGGGGFGGGGFGSGGGLYPAGGGGGYYSGAGGINIHPAASAYSNDAPGLGGSPLLHHQDSNYPYQPYRSDNVNPNNNNNNQQQNNVNGFPFGQHVIREIVNVYETSNQEAEENDRRKKNFVWRNDS